jgi:hypothetical protein
MYPHIGKVYVQRVTFESRLTNLVSRRRVELQNLCLVVFVPTENERAGAVTKTCISGKS